MKKKLTFLLLLFSFFLMPLKAEENPGYCTINLVPTVNPDSGTIKVDDPSKRGNRLPSRHIECYLSLTEGVVIPTVDTIDIISYGIYDLSGVSIGMFSEAADFIAFLFSQSGSFEIRFTTEDYIYVGYVAL